MSVAIPVISYIDGAARRIYLLQGVDAFHWIDDIYREYVHMRAVDEALHKWAPMMRAYGNNPKGGGKYTPRYVTLLDGCRVVPYDENILINVTGEAITDNADVDPDPFDTSTRVQPLKLYITPPAAEIVRDVEALAAIERMEFDNKVAIDAVNGVAGTAGNIGTKGNPVNNITDAITIAQNRKFDTLYVIGPLTIGAGADLTGFTIVGQNAIKTVLTLEPAAIINSVEIYECRVTGTLDGDIIVRESVIDGLTYVTGFIHQCAITSEMIIAAPGSTVMLMDCYSIAGGVALVDVNGENQNVSLSGVKGVWKLENVGAGSQVEVDLDPGQLILDTATMIGGTLRVRGPGMLMDEFMNNIPTGTLGGTTIVNSAICPHSIAHQIFNLSEMEPGLTLAAAVKILTAALVGKLSGADSNTLTFRDINDTKNRITATIDGNGNRTSVTTDVS